MRIVLSLFLFFINCTFTPKNMNISIENIQTIVDFPSGSGVAYINNKIYAIGDDSPYLYVINSDFKLDKKILLYEENQENFKGNRIKKKRKMDFETLEVISEKELVIFGSGSKSPQRDMFFRVLLDKNIIVEKYSISDFYDLIRNSDLLKNEELNIEATAFANGFLYLFNRSNNVIIKVFYQNFLESLKTQEKPNLSYVRVPLPSIEGVEAGFSGATILRDQTFVFTASVEATDDAYNDGEIMGSLIGLLDFSDFEKPKVLKFRNISNLEKNLKVESVAVISTSAKDSELVLITDDDQGNTELIKVKISE